MTYQSVLVVENKQKTYHTGVIITNLLEEILHMGTL